MRIGKSVTRILILGLWPFLFLAAVVAAADNPSADRLLEEGLTASRNGSFPQAVSLFTRASQAYEQEGKTRERTQVLIHLSQALEQVGSYREAGGVLVTALDSARTREDRILVPVILGRLGAVYFALGSNQKAEQSLNDALFIAREDKRLPLLASLLNDLANVLASQGQYAAAESAYLESADLATSSRNQTLAVTAMINRAKSLAQDGRQYEALASLDEGARQVSELDESYDKGFVWLSLGVAYERLLPRQVFREHAQEDRVRSKDGGRGIAVLPGTGEPGPTPGSPEERLSGTAPLDTKRILRQAAAAFWSAVTIAAELDDARLESYGWGYLGALYERNGRVEEALQLSRRAVFLAQRAHAPESLYRWHWQTGRLLAVQDKMDEAILAYRRALQTLQPIRPELLVGPRERQLSFRDTTGRLYFELADLLLRRATATEVSDPEQYRELLSQAQNTMESFKAAELQDYFQDACVGAAQAKSTSLAESTHDTVLIYPIVLSDRLELLVSFPDGLKHFVVPVSARVLTQEADTFRRALEDRSHEDYLAHARTLYEWLISPLQKELDRAGITTLVFVPDGALRTIPMAPLHDGKNFLIEKYALAVTPGLMLTDPRPISRVNVKMLSAGLSESVQGFPALPNVEKELGAIQTLYGGTLLLNDQFQIIKLEQTLRDQPFTILHIASHGTVQRDVRDSYILAFDDKITMDRLAELVGLLQFRDSPLELLTLSACETAAGDDRAALGLAGVAIKAGARSALATLWFIDDAAASDLVEEFYRQLQNSAQSKAVALQQAQRAILKDPARRHPSYWAPFLLINNWL